MKSPQPLRLPSPWPPPSLPQSERSQSLLEYIPIIGWLIGWWRERHRRSVHVSQVLMPIERQIVDQLVARSLSPLWPHSSSHQRIADIMGSAVAAEKGLKGITVHPDDLVELLFWGAEDDLSPLRFALRLQEEFGIVLSTEDMEAFFKNHMTVSEVIAFCLIKNRSNVLGLKMKPSQNHNTDEGCDENEKGGSHVNAG